MARMITNVALGLRPTGLGSRGARKGYRFQEARKGAIVPKREKIGAGNAALYVRRDEQGRFTTDQVDVGRSLATDQKRKAKSTAKPGYGDRGDRKR
jgi:hypothetical protein